MGWFSGQSKAAKELERKRQQEKDEENAKKADDVCVRGAEDSLSEESLDLGVPCGVTPPSTRGHRTTPGVVSLSQKCSAQVDKPPNVLRVTVIRAKDLPAVDKKQVLQGAGVRGPLPLHVRRRE